ncbi:MAG: NAD(P)-dependent oxidoreductase [Verrucomicrobiales bacterium]|nr:NAD(P)-dependent oxidoreductase [Verrucomicrobiales bacterium]
MHPGSVGQSSPAATHGSRKGGAGRVGLVGVGLLGAALAERLIAGGRRVLGFDVDPARLRVLDQVGGESAVSAEDVVAHCDTVVLSLPTSRIVAALLGELIPRLTSRHVLLDTTTGAPDDAVRAGERVGAVGAAYLDSTVSGSSEQVRRGEGLVMVGGDREAFELCRPLLERLADRVVHVGPVGSGAKMKLATNLVLGLNRAALAEGLAFAGALGLDPAQTLAILQASPAASRIMEAKGPKMVTGDFRPQARLSQHLKDVRLILELGRETGARLPLSETHRTLLKEAEAAGWGGLDNSAIFKTLAPPASHLEPQPDDPRS